MHPTDLQAIANALGEVKGKVGNAKADPPLLENGKLNVGRAVGKGKNSQFTI